MDSDNIKHYDRYKRSSYESYNFKMPEIYDNSFWMKFFKTNEWDDEVVSQLGEPLHSVKVLDVGCATGRLLNRMAKTGVKGLSGADLAAKILDVAKEKLSSINAEVDLKVADAEEKLPWSDNCFDFVTLTGVFHHFYKPHKSLQEICRVLKTDGRLILMEPWFPPVLRQLSNVYLLFFNHDGDCKFHSPNGLIKLIETSNLSIHMFKRIARFSFMIVAQKDKP